MIALVQRVSEASVSVEGRVEGKIGRGLLILLGVHQADTEREVSWVARKCVNLRIFPDDQGLMNRSLLDVDGEALIISQFTLYGDTAKGNRPSFTESAPGDKAKQLYDEFVRVFEQLLGKPVQQGIFGAMMQVYLVNDGPVTLWVEKAPG
jgi:D-tyrosyl-tRNA(Tyr) deacylase